LRRKRKRRNDPDKTPRQTSGIAGDELKALLAETPVQTLSRDRENFRLIYINDGLYAGANKKKVDASLAEHLKQSQASMYGKGKFDGVK
jgi:hypothetical protein